MNEPTMILFHMMVAILILVSRPQKIDKYIGHLSTVSGSFPLRERVHRKTNPRHVLAYSATGVNSQGTNSRLGQEMDSQSRAQQYHVFSIGVFSKSNLFTFYLMAEDLCSYL